MRLPSDWDAEKASGWWQLHHLIHKPCGLRTGMAYDLICSEADVRRVIRDHQCEEADQ